MLPFVLSLLMIFVIALAVVAAFAWPQLRAGSPILTSRGDRVAGTLGRWFRPVAAAVGPPFRRVARLVANALRTVTAPVAKPLGQALRPRVGPLAQAISRAVEEGGDPAPSHLPGRSGPVAGQRDGRVTKDELPVP